MKRQQDTRRSVAIGRLIDYVLLGPMSELASYFCNLMRARYY
jgi:hypothetical protein